ncbi:AMP-binding protein [Streptomyces sp. NPDC088116]|uniref:AMP-binding protein n=1 Tax=Streptomyces sp. NPDC088116 TaxID=3365825 RepID=UPI003820F82E
MTGGSIHQLFEERARQAPDRVAVVTDGDQYSYLRVDTEANRLAAYLVESGGLPGSGSAAATVAICTERPLDALVAMLAVLKAGHAYAVVAPRTPGEELHRLLGLARAKAVITQRALLPRIDDGRDRTAVCLDRDAEAIAAHSGVAPPTARGTGGRDMARNGTRKRAGPAARTRATVLFTAGTTGKRTAVVSGHDRWIAAYTAWAEVYALSPQDQVLVTALPETTEFTGGWIRALCSGGTLVLSDRLISTESVTVVEADPRTAARLLTRDLPALRLLAVGGEPLRLDEQLRLQELLPTPEARVVSVYGPAEVVGCGTWFEPEQLPGAVEYPERAAYLGRPFPGCAAELRKGRIWLTPPDGGDAVATGDVGRRQAEGPLEFRGRTADRVTVNGRTVDTYRVESALGGHPGLREVAVTADKGRTGNRLIAFVAPVSGPTELRSRLTGLVPAGDIPGSVVRIPRLPRNAAGKVDRAKLPLPPVPRAASGGGKGGEMSPEDVNAVIAVVVTLCAGFLSAALTNVFWPGSTDLTGVPTPWNVLFGFLYFFEWLAFGLGMGFLAMGRQPMLRHGAPRGITTLAHLAIVWLLAAWWPQDNFYRLAAKTDWPRQAALVYTFNVTLMLAAAIVVVWVNKRPAVNERT